VAIGLILAFALAAQGEPGRDTPTACRPDGQGRVDYAACVAVARPGSPERSLALINLGTQAFLQNDFATAVRRYDEAVLPGQKLYSDAIFHAFRGAAYQRVGRKTEALENARTALAVLRGQRFPGVSYPKQAEDPENVLPYILPILKEGQDPEYTSALAAYRGLPAKDWISYANRSAVLTELDDLDGAAAANAQAMKLEPNHPMVLNNACVLDTKRGRPTEALPYCTRAVAAAPDVAAVHDSRADALAALGRCAEAAGELQTARRLDPASKTYQRELACKAR